MDAGANNMHALCKLGPLVLQKKFDRQRIKDRQVIVLSRRQRSHERHTLEVFDLAQAQASIPNLFFLPLNNSSLWLVNPLPLIIVQLRLSSLNELWPDLGIAVTEV